MTFLLVSGAYLLHIFSRVSCPNCDLYDEDDLHDKKQVFLITLMSHITNSHHVYHMNHKNQSSDNHPRGQSQAGIFVLFCRDAAFYSKKMPD